MTRASRLLSLALGSVLAVSAVTLHAGVAQAGPPANAPSQNRFQQRLGLTDDQMTAIRDIHARYADQRRQVGKALAQAQRELRVLALNGGDAAAVKAKSAEVTGLIGQAIELRAASLSEMSPLLTPEQRDKLANMSPHHGRPGGGRS